MATYQLSKNKSNLITFTGYAVGTTGRKIVMSVDKEFIDYMGEVHTFYGKRKAVGDFITVDTRSCTFNITNHEWSDIENLVGVHLKIICTVRTFTSRYTTNHEKQPYTKQCNREYETYAAVFSASEIKNIE